MFPKTYHIFKPLLNGLNNPEDLIHQLDQKIY